MWNLGIFLLQFSYSRWLSPHAIRRDSDGVMTRGGLEKLGPLLHMNNPPNGLGKNVGSEIGSGSGAECCSSTGSISGKSLMWNSLLGLSWKWVMKIPEKGSVVSLLWASIPVASHSLHHFCFYNKQCPSELSNCITPSFEECSS